MVNDLGRIRIDDIDLEITTRSFERYTAVADDFASVRGETDWTMGFHHDKRTARADTRIHR